MTASSLIRTGLLVLREIRRGPKDHPTIAKAKNFSGVMKSFIVSGGPSNTTFKLPNGITVDEAKLMKQNTNTAMQSILKQMLKDK